MFPDNFYDLNVENNVLRLKLAEKAVRKYLKGNLEVYKYGYKKAVWYGVFNFFANFFVFGSMAVILGLGSKLY